MQFLLKSKLKDMNETLTVNKNPPTFNMNYVIVPTFYTFQHKNYKSINIYFSS